MQRSDAGSGRSRPLRCAGASMACSCLVLQDDEIGRRPVERDAVAGNEQAARACIGLLHEESMAALERDAVEHRAAKKIGVFDDTMRGGAGGVAARRELFFL